MQRLKGILKRICIIYRLGFILVLEIPKTLFFQSGKSKAILVSQE